MNEHKRSFEVSNECNSKLNATFIANLRKGKFPQLRKCVFSKLGAFSQLNKEKEQKTN